MVVVTTCTTLQLKEIFYVSRPLKFIELTREDKDVLSLDIKVEGKFL
jgi:hypothetical protein